MTDEERTRFQEEEERRGRVRLANSAYLEHGDTGLPVEVVLVGCSSKKMPSATAMPASELYRGRLAQLGYHYAKDRGWDVHFLSALHGVVEPHQQLYPYDFSMVKLRHHERLEWGRKVIGDLVALYILTRVRLIFFAGASYVRPIACAMAEENELDYWTIEEPLRGLDLFERFAWFKTNQVSR